MLSEERCRIVLCYTETQPATEDKGSNASQRNSRPLNILKKGEASTQTQSTVSHYSVLSPWGWSGCPGGLKSGHILATSRVDCTEQKPD
ncbi:hypothetical protein J4Q44_G00233950 [Coregonus suidteri]|uniref:Uncharacterized protein n=1 Tax=Coregonus suidteri TaxID=861788 RepID=A0AAN8QKL4_9TELE